MSPAGRGHESEGVISSLRSRPLLVGLSVDPLEQQVGAASRRALIRAAQLARLTDAPLVLVHAVPGDVFVEDGGSCEARFSYHLSEAGRYALLDALHEVQDQGVQAELTFRPERPVSALTGEAARRRAALILLGAFECAEGELGTVARGVLAAAPCPVWIVHPREPENVRLVDEGAGDGYVRLLDARVSRPDGAPLRVARDPWAADASGSSLILAGEDRGAREDVG